jgi:hypothetical protein
MLGLILLTVFFGTIACSDWRAGHRPFDRIR